MNSSTATPIHHPSPQEWKEIVAKYQQPSRGLAIWQIVNTLGPYVLLWYLMYLSLDVSYWITLGLAMLAAAFTVRIFIIFHDCTHGSFFKSKTANTVLGFITGLLTFTPFSHWKMEHTQHHASSGDLDRRGSGDIWTMTVQEYLESSRWKKFAYRLARNPFVLFVLGPLYLSLFWQRFPAPGSKKKERVSVMLMNLAILAMTIVMSLIFGFWEYVLIHLTIMMLAGSAGIWLFYVQHQFEGVYWERADEWDFTQAALAGSSFYKLPKVLQWFTGNIGYHHIHHLSPKIPNYHLERCHKSHSIFRKVKAVTLFGSLKSFTFRLWDEQRRVLVGFGYLRTLQRQQQEGV